MLFSSPIFIVFFLAYLLVHIALPDRFRLYLIIIGSTIFYGYWNPYYIWIPYTLCLIAFFGTRWIASTSQVSNRKTRAAVTIGMLLLPLVFYKYVNFLFADVAGLLFSFYRKGQVVDFALPLGISFVTFTMIAYTIDVYRRDCEVEYSAPTLTGFTLFFPQLIAGPILRAKDLIPQLKHPKHFLDAKITLGILIFSIGAVKKLVFADPLGDVVTTVYSGVQSLAGWDYLLAFYAFSAQIYCDFSGYIDMGIGSAMVLGITLPINFERPYLATSIPEFWRRWHITLSRWLRDYLYIPLGGNRHGFKKQIPNVFITMGLGGLWHGAGWTFIIWGILHGCGIAAGHLARNKKIGMWTQYVPKGIKILLTFHIVSAAWVIFRAQDITTVQRFFSGLWHAGYNNGELFLSQHAFPITLLVIFAISHSLDHMNRIRQFALRAHPATLWALIILLWVLSVAISTGSSETFIYFDF